LEKFEELALPLLKEKKMKIEVHEVSLSSGHGDQMLMAGVLLGQDSGCTQGDGRKQEQRQGMIAVFVGMEWADR
jgi:hypothetical protein